MVSLRGLLAVVLAGVVVAGSVGCRPKKKPDFGAELPPGQLALRKIPMSQWPDFANNNTDPQALARALENSAKYLRAPSSKNFFPYLDITHERAVATVAALRQVVAEEIQRGWDAGRFGQRIRNNFEVYKSIGAPNPEGPGYTDKVLFTGYFTPIYDASLTKQGPYVWPVYKRPADLITDERGETAFRKTPEGSQVPYYTRQQIEQGNLLAGQELVYLKSRWEAYVITVQGSARLKLVDQGGRMYEIGYNGNNGYSYTSPGRQMLADGVITKDQLSLRGLRAYFEQHPQAMDKYLALNPRFVFFTERPGGPFGSLNVPVTPWGTIATDKAVYPRAMPGFLTVDVPASVGGQVPYRGFMMDQDTGGAIRAAGRTDIYMGIGPKAEEVAGHELNEGELFYVAVRPELVSGFAEAARAQQPGKK